MYTEKNVKLDLNVVTDIPFSDKIEDPSVIDPTGRINILGNEIFDMSTISDGIKLYRVKSDGEEVEEDIIININENISGVYINKSNNTNFTEGEVYKLSINKKLKSFLGVSLKTELNSYFAIDYSFNLDSKGIPDLNNERNLTICISDIHLGINENIALINQNRDALVDFLNHVRNSPNIKELIIAGDLIDEWTLPMEFDTFNGKTQLDFVKATALTNKPVIDAINNIIEDGKVKMTYIPGNHDLLLNSSDIQSILPGIVETRDARGLGAYTPADLPQVIIEHGHRYNFYCAPDPSNQSITQTDSLLPPGYFFSRIATSSVIQGRPKRDSPLPIVKNNEMGEDQYGYFIYWSVWKIIIDSLPIKQSLDEKAIIMGIDGFTDSCSINDVLPYQNPEDGNIDVNLYKGCIEGWDERQNENLVPVKIPVDEAVAKGNLPSFLDYESGVQYLNNQDSDKRIAIFGHSHEARVIKSVNENDEKTVYVNSGTWIDRNPLTRTFVVITPPKSKNSAPTYVNLYQYSPSGDIRKVESQALTDLK